MSYGRKIDRDIRVGAVADYLVGRQLKEITTRWGVNPATVNNWVRGVRHIFLMRCESRQDKLRA